MSEAGDDFTTLSLSSAGVMSLQGQHGPSPGPSTSIRLSSGSMGTANGGNDVLKRLSFVPPPPSQLSDRKRESTLDSADQAEGIFDLYEHDRDSWQPASVQSKLKGDDSLGRGDEVEVIRDRIDSLGSWEGPLSTLSNPSQRISVSQDGALRPEFNPEESRRDSIRLAPQNEPAPGLLVTPDRSLRAHTTNGMNGKINGRGSLSQRDSIMSVSSTSTSLAPNSTNPSPMRGGITRLSTIGNGIVGAGKSEVSFGGSSQYPGEENDAFFVRSTYARLEAEGVHGDGWDPGVERTRGGPAQGKRATMFQATKTGIVGQAEKDYLANLDRYGFVNEPLRNRSETRLALVPTAPLLKIPKLPSTSPIPPGSKVSPPPPSMHAPDGPMPRTPDTPKPNTGENDQQRKKENDRVSKWMKMMSVKKRDQGGNTIEWGWKSESIQKVHKRVYKGIPDRWRMAAWWTLSSDRTREYSTKGKGRERPNELLLEDYRHMIDLPSTHDVQIDLDVPRTISGHTLFVTRYGSGQRNLFHVLHCFSLLCETCGYCQGMGPIAATLLCYFDPERVYALLVRLHDVYGMHSIFAPGFPGLLEAFYVQERLMEYLMPEVYKSFQRNMISSSAWGTKWYITLFVNTLPFSQQLRLWDALWLEGRDVMIMTSIAILWSFKDLLSAPNANFESILSLLSSYFVAEDEDALMRFIRKMLAQPGVKSKMDGWRVEWANLVKEGKEGTALL